jgi:cytochrome c553
MTIHVKQIITSGAPLVVLAQVLIAPSPLAAQSADVASGRKRAEVCMACHGEKGISAIPGVPNLAGQEREYLVKALHAYRGGQLRRDPTMTEMARPLSDTDIVNLAAFWSNLGAK